MSSSLTRISERKVHNQVIDKKKIILKSKRQSKIALESTVCAAVGLQRAPLNGITLGQRETDSNNRLILISDSTKHTLGWKWKSGICKVK